MVFKTCPGNSAWLASTRDIQSQIERPNYR